MTVTAERPATREAGISGAEILEDARRFAAGVLYAPDEYLDALTLACAVTHTLTSFTTVPRLLFTSPQKESGKTTALDVVAMLANNGWMADPTSYALRAKFNEPEPPTLLIDEISDIFGKSGLRGRSNPLGRILREGYRRSATLSMAVDRVAEDVSSFSVAAFGGLGTAVPDDIRSRCIVFRMKPVPPSVPPLADSQDPDTQALGERYRAMVHQWAVLNADEIKRAYRDMRRPHRKFRDRRRQVWGSLYAVALVAGGDWPARCMAAFKAMALDASDQPVLSPHQMVLRDVAGIFEATGSARMLGRTLRSMLQELPDIELYERLSERKLADLMCDALGESQAMTVDGQRGRGWDARPVLASWRRLEAQLDTAGDDPEDDTDPFEVEDDEGGDVTEVTHVTDGGVYRVNGRAGNLGANQGADVALGPFGTLEEAQAEALVAAKKACRDAGGDGSGLSLRWQVLADDSAWSAACPWGAFAVSRRNT